MKICVCGKGGSGKSTVVSLLAAGFKRSGKDVFVLDSDESNASLFWMLGFDRPPRPLMDLVGGKRIVQQQMFARFTRGEDEPTMTIWEMEELLSHEIPSDYVVENEDCKLLATGKIHQSLEGCACPMGAVTREFLKRLRLARDEIAVVDMEAGIEHFGRGVEASVDMVLCVVEPSLESVSLAKKAMDLTETAGASFKGAILNKISSSERKNNVIRKLNGVGVPVIGAIGYDSGIESSCLEGCRLNAQAVAADVAHITDELLQDAVSPEKRVTMEIQSSYVADGEFAIRRSETTKHFVDKEQCCGCGTCIEVCPTKIIEEAKDGKARFISRIVHLCLSCGHCMASCPSQAVFAKGLTYEDDFYPLPERVLDREAFKGLLETRRSVRVFKDEPVPREKLEKIVSLIAMAPMGVPLHKVEITVVDRRETIDKALPYIVAFCRKMEKWASNPITRFIMRRQMSLERFNVVNGFLRPLIKELLPHMKQTGRDIITWNAPAMFLFHADKGAECHTENIFIDLAYGLLAAHSMGLGATPIGVVPPAVEMTPALRRLFDIPKGHEVLSSMILGYPKRPFRRAIKREMADVRWIGTKYCTGAMLL